MKNYFDFTGKVALVVGVGGLGGAQALGFAEQGADIVAADFRPETAEGIAAKAREMGRKSLAVTVDVSDPSSVADMVSRTLQDFPRIDILVNAAGTTFRHTDSSDFPLDKWQNVFNVNTKGTWLCCQTVGNQMLKQGGGIIINISSVAGSYGAPRGGAAYGPSKAAVNNITKSLALEWAGKNIRVNALAPTVIETDFTREVVENPDTSAGLKKRIPMGRWGVPEDIVGPTLFLASEASRFITGQIMFIDGGISTQLY